MKQTTAMGHRYGFSGIKSNAYVWMIWAEITVCLAFSIVCWLYLRGIVAPRYEGKYVAVYLTILLTRE
jgi:hypothetical protein